MAFTAGELASIANAALDFHFKGQPLPQSIQDKPLLAKLEGSRKTFPGGKGDITIPVKGKYAFEGAASPLAGSLRGYTHDDPVAYGNIAGIERVKYPWREVHTGWNVTFTELKVDGISVVDSAIGENTSKHSKREVTAITNIMEDKVETFGEITAKALNTMFWGDGTVDPLGFIGVRYFITPTPAVGVTGGLDRATNTWWQNRYATWAAATVDIPNAIHTEMRQLRRYGGKPTLALAGSGFLDALVTALRAKGFYTDLGWSKPANTDIAVADIRYGDLVFQYDPSLDDLGGAYVNSCYIIDPKHLYIYAMEQEYGKDHAPARPHDVYGLFKARTYTGQLVADQLNCHGLYRVT
jgi:hypothetical protein